jgi:hypothetical protein
VCMHKTNCLKIYIDNIHIFLCVYIEREREKDKMNIYIVHKRLNNGVRVYLFTSKNRETNHQKS